MLRPQETTIRLRHGKRQLADELQRLQEDRKITITDRGGILSRRNHILQEVRLTIPGIHGIEIIQMVPGTTMDQAGIRIRRTHHQVVVAVVQCVKVRHPAQERVVGLGAGTN